MAGIHPLVCAAVGRDNGKLVGFRLPSEDVKLLSLKLRHVTLSASLRPGVKMVYQESAR